MPEKVKNKVTKTIRMDFDLHERLQDHVQELGRGLPPKQRPSIDSVVQRAVQRLLDSGDLDVPPPPADAPANDREQRYVSALLQALRTETDAHLLKGLTSILDYFMPISGEGKRPK